MRIVLFLIAITVSSTAVAQFEKNYTPIKYTGTIPPYFISSIKEKVEGMEKEGLLKVDGVSKDETRLFYSGLSASLNAQLLSSNIYFNDELSAYVNKVGQILLTNSKYKTAIRFYVARFSSVNAVCWGEGTIIINIGLLSRLNNEAELAFILSHEIAHFEEDHTARSLKMSKKLETDYMNKDRMLKAVMETMRFSRENEYEADLAGFKIFEKSGYNPTAAISALKLLEESKNEKYNKEINLPLLFQEKLDGRDSISYLISREDFFNRTSKSKVYTLSSSDEDDDEDADLSTHPEIGRRIIQINKVLKDSSDKTSNLFKIATPEQFEHYKIIVDFEQIETNLAFLYFPRALFLSLQLMELYPENEYLQESALQALYYMAYYKKANGYKSLANKFNQVRDYSYGSFLKYFESRNYKSISSLTIPWMESIVKKYPNNEEMLISLAKMYDLDNDTYLAKNFYNDYLDKFPTGKHANFVKHQLKK